MTKQRRGTPPGDRSSEHNTQAPATAPRDDDGQAHGAPAADQAWMLREDADGQIALWTPPGSIFSPWEPW